MNVTYTQCVSEAIVIQLSSTQCAYYSRSAASLAPPYFSTLLHTRHEVQKNVTEYKICVLTFSKSLSKTYFILKRIH